MFDDPNSLRAAAIKYRRIASRTVERDIANVLLTVAEKHDLMAAALQAEQESGLVQYGWDSILRP